MKKIHFKAPGCWINDPNGFIWFRGQYHLFYQCFPYSAQWGRMHWGHAVSSDLVHWENKGIALYPTKTDDRSGCFSGSAVEHDGRMYIYYTGVNYTEENPENINTCLNDEFTAAQMMITSEDGMKFDNVADKKTVIPPIEDRDIGDKNHTRDPKVWRGKDAWYMVLGSTKDKKGRLLVYRSADLSNWEPAGFTEKENFGWMWECPDYFETDGTGLTVFSPMGFTDDGKLYDSNAICVLSSFDEEKGKINLSDDYQYLDLGLDLYAPQSTTDEDGKRVLIAWMRMPESVTDENGEWNGIMCIPRTVEIKDGHVCFRPHRNVKNAFSRKISSPEESGYMVRTSLEEGDSINIGGYVIKLENGRVTADRSAVFGVNGNYRLTAETPVLKNGCELEIYADKNLIEVYINDGEYVISHVVYGLTDKISGKAYEMYGAE